MLLNEHNKADFQECLLNWFKQSHRDFPWRSYKSAYATLIAEKLLQQTIARETVVRAYQQILERYPGPEKLAQADIIDLEKIIKPLGFLYRAYELRAMAQALLERHDGKVPQTLEELLVLPGIGDYAARAILSFVFEQDVPIVDINVARFLYRVYNLQDKFPSNPARKRSLINMAANLVPSGRSRDFNLAILDLCALICKTSKPECQHCPVRIYCEFGSNPSYKLADTCSTS